MLAIFGNPQVSQWMGDGRPLNRQQCQQWIDKSQHNYQHKGYGAFAIVLSEGGDMVGCGGLVHDAGDSSCEIIYALKQDWWGQGLGLEMAEAILSFARQETGLTELVATIDPENTASAHILNRLGMRYQHTLPDEQGLPTATYYLTL